MPSHTIRHRIPCGRPSLPIVLTGAVALAIFWLGFPALAEAAPNEVHFDPDSPAGKEYALPLDQARDEATGGGSDRASGESAPLFGAGISGADPRGGKSQDRGGGPSGERETSGAGSRSSQDRSRAADPRLVLPAASDGYPLASGAGLVAAILLLGGAMALALRALQRLSLR